MRFFALLSTVLASVSAAQAACTPVKNSTANAASLTGAGSSAVASTVSASSSASASASASGSGKHHHKGGSSSAGASASPTSTFAASNVTSTFPASNATSATASSSAASSTASSVDTSLTRVQAAGNGAYFIGASSYYLYTYADDDRAAVLDAMQSAGMTVIRIFISAVAANNKGSNNAAVNDVEVDYIGTYDDTILTQVDQLMYEASQRGMKLLIALHDRYALGFWSTDIYCTQLGISPYTNNPPQIADASAFYTNSWASSMFDQRMTHILNHQNAQMGNVAWKDLDSAIYGFEPQNEPMGHMDLVAPNWVCDRAKTLAGLIPAGSSILISSGGGIDADSSVGDWAFGCGEIDVVAVHDYNLGSDFLDTIKSANEQAKQQGRVSVVGEWGVMGDDKESKAQTIVDALQGDGISWLYWEVTKPGAGSSNFEVWTDEPTWNVLASASPNNSNSSKKRALEAASLYMGDSHKARAVQVAKSRSRRRHHGKRGMYGALGHHSH